MRARSANSAVSPDHIGRILEDMFIGFDRQHTLSFKSHEKDFLKTSEKDCNVFTFLWTLYYGSVLATKRHKRISHELTRKNTN